MVPQHFLNKIIALEAFAIEFKEQTTGLRSEVERFYALPPKGGKKKALDATQEAAIIAKRMQSIIK